MCGLVPGVLPNNILCDKKEPGSKAMHVVVTIQVCSYIIMSHYIIQSSI